MIQPGQMNTRIHVYKSFAGKYKPPPKRICSLWAMMKTVTSAEEDLRVAAITSSFKVDFLVWNNVYSRRVRSSHMIDTGYGNNKYAVNAIIPDASDRAYLHIICTFAERETDAERL